MLSTTYIFDNILQIKFDFFSSLYDVLRYNLNDQFEMNSFPTIKLESGFRIRIAQMFIIKINLHIKIEDIIYKRLGISNYLKFEIYAMIFQPLGIAGLIPTCTHIKIHPNSRFICMQIYVTRARGHTKLYLPTKN